jgi:hypothetical protein
MTRPRLTWKTGRWSEGAQVEPLPVLREQYGDDVGDVAEFVRSLVQDRRDQPNAQDVKRTLQSIVDDPVGADLDRLDEQTHCELQREALSRFREPYIAKLSPEQLVLCAAAARAGYRRAAGAPPTDDLALILVRAMLHHCPPTMQASERDTMLGEALLACQLGAGGKTVERLVRKARQVL